MLPAWSQGDPRKVIYPTDSRGQFCGQAGTPLEWVRLSSNRSWSYVLQSILPLTCNWKLCCINVDPSENTWHTFFFNCLYWQNTARKLLPPPFEKALSASYCQISLDKHELSCCAYIVGRSHCCSTLTSWSVPVPWCSWSSSVQRHRYEVLLSCIIFERY